MEQRKEDLVDAEVQLPPGRILDLYRSGVSWWNITNILSSEPGAPCRAYVNAHVHAIITGSQVRTYGLDAVCAEAVGQLNPCDFTRTLQLRKLFRASRQ